MKRKFSIPILLLLAGLFLGLGDALAASLELGHVRARTRGWTDEQKLENGENPAVEPELLEAYPVEADVENEAYTEESFEFLSDQTESEVQYDEEVEDEVLEEIVLDPFQVKPTVREKSPLRIGKHIRKSLNGLMLIGKQREREPSLRDGYLVMGAAPALRFSDDDLANNRPMMPALPEFSFSSGEYLPYLIETALPEDAMNDPSMLSELVIELEPHEVISGVIDTSRHQQEELVEHFDLEEERSTVLRPEEILIYFETDTTSGSTGAMVPFAPTKPTNNTTIKSSATMKKE